MGVEFGLSAIPSCEVDAARLAVLHGIVDGVTEAVYEEDGPDDGRHGNAAEWREDLHKAVAILPEMHEREWRYLNHLEVFPNQPYGVVFTGGLSWGDDHDLYEHFESLRSYRPLLEQLAAWAREEWAARGPVTYDPTCEPLPE